jgi:hypothetical protein
MRENGKDVGRSHLSMRISVSRRSDRPPDLTGSPGTWHDKLGYHRLALWRQFSFAAQCDVRVSMLARPIWRRS